MPCALDYVRNVEAAPTLEEPYYTSAEGTTQVKIGKTKIEYRSQKSWSSYSKPISNAIGKFKRNSIIYPEKKISELLRSYFITV